jgi:hypothetical protein
MSEMSPIALCWISKAMCNKSVLNSRMVVEVRK